jgi:hypothetical protein
MLSLRRSSLPCACSRVALPFRHVLAPVRRQSITSPGGLAREFEELERLRTALSRSQAEVTQLRTNLRSQEIQNERNSEELRTYREALSKVFFRSSLHEFVLLHDDDRNHDALYVLQREEENSSSRTAEDRNREIAVSAFISQCVHE